MAYKCDMNVLDQAIGEKYALYLGDSCQVMKGIPDASVHLTISSIPFGSLYVYSSSVADLGNSKDDAEFFQHFDYLVPELFRVTIPGRLAAIHVKNLVNYMSRDGESGLRDFRGDVIRRFQAFGWAYHSEVCIWTDPVLEMERTKSHGLLYKQLRADGTFSRQGLAEYLLLFRRWPKNEDDAEKVEPVTHTHETMPLDIWQRYASPVWFDIRRTDVLNVRIARDNADEKHLCPLQLTVIERAIELWSNPNDVVLDPFCGVGSTVYEAVRLGRRGIGIELKDAYWRQSVQYVSEIEAQTLGGDLFSYAGLSMASG